MNNEWKEITDPEELFKLKREGWEIEFANSSSNIFAIWSGLAWNVDRQFRARPRQPKMKKVKLLAWFDGDQLFWLAETAAPKWPSQRIRCEDKEIEVPE